MIVGTRWFRKRSIWKSWVWLSRMNSIDLVCVKRRIFIQRTKAEYSGYSAFPIPRTLGIILYGDLDISIIDELPAQRLPIRIVVTITGTRLTALSKNRCRKVIRFMWSCPMVEESEGMDGENVIDYAEQAAPWTFIFCYCWDSSRKKMKPKEKNEIIERSVRTGSSAGWPLASWCQCAQCHGDDGRKCRTVWSCPVASGAVV